MLIDTKLKRATRLVLVVGSVLLNVGTVQAQSLLYDNTDHIFSKPHSGSRNVIWAGPAAPGEWFDAQPFNIGGHDNISSVSIPMARNMNVSATGTVRVSIWDDNGRGFPGQEVGEMGLIDVESLPRYDFPGNQGGPDPAIVANPLPLVTFESPIDDLTPGETYFVVTDYRGLSHIQFGDVLAGVSTTSGSNRSGDLLYGDGFPEPPFEDSDWTTAVTFFAPHRYYQMSVTTADQPYNPVVCPVGTIYEEEFTLADDGGSTTFLPTGWAFSDYSRHTTFDGHGLSEQERLLAVDERVFDTSITDAFPADRSLGRGTPVFNAGTPGDSDRALALGVTRTSEDAMLQLVAEVAGGDANSVQLAFDIEAWDAANSRDNPGEAAFNVALDLDTGDGFQQIMDFGKVTTGATLVPPAGEFVNGNDDAYRTSFDSGLMNMDLPEGSQLRVRWMADLEAETRGWVFGLDNVSLGMFADSPSVPGDFNADGLLTAEDVDLLSAELREPLGDLAFDLNNDGEVNGDDHTHWVHDKNIANSFFGDANLDGEFNSSDLTAVFKTAKYELDVDASWAEGDWNGDQRFDSGDLVAAFKDGGYETGPRAAVAAVPEPSSWMLLTLGFASFGRFRRKA